MPAPHVVCSWILLGASFCVDLRLWIKLLPYFSTTYVYGSWFLKWKNTRMGVKPSKVKSQNMKFPKLQYENVFLLQLTLLPQSYKYFITALTYGKTTVKPRLRVENEARLVRRPTTIHPTTSKVFMEPLSIYGKWRLTDFRFWYWPLWKQSLGS